MTQPVIVNSTERLSTIIGLLRELFNSHKYLRVSIKTGKDRSLDQNAISHVWYEQIARELRDQSATEAKRYCKLHHGVPILRAEDADFREFYDSAIRPHLTYEQKLKAMDHVPVTSSMTVDQLSRYLVAVQDDFANRSADRVILEFPEAP